MKRQTPLMVSLLLGLLFSQAGCWDYTEYEDMAQITGIGIDYDRRTGETTMTVQYTPTTKGQSSGGPGAPGSAPSTQVVHAAKGRTVYEALPKLQQAISKRLFYGYLRTLVLGQEAARYNLLDFLELHQRTPAIRDTSRIVITPGRAEETISTLDAAMITSSGEEISRLVDMGEITGAAYPVSLQDFNASLSIAGLEATAPRVITVAPKKQIEVKGGSEQDLRYDEEREGDVRIEGIAAFRGTRLVGWLEDREALGFGWITGKHLKAYKVSEPAETSFSPNLTFYRIRHSKGGIKVNIHQGKPAFAVDVHVEADLRKYYSDTSSKFLGPEVISRLERKLVDSIRVDIQQALRKGQKELKTDIFGFGFALFRKNPDLWQDKYAKNWQQTFPNIPITLKVSARVTNTGTITNKLEVK